MTTNMTSDELKAMTADAARYNWLIKGHQMQPRGMYSKTRMEHSDKKPLFQFHLWGSKKQIDQTIDDAIAETKKLQQMLSVSNPVVEVREGYSDEEVAIKPL